MNILVTGVTGFVGSVLLPELVKKYKESKISILVLPEDHINPFWEENDIEIIKGDITDRDRIIMICRDKTHVIHLAGLISFWKKDLEKLKAVNIDGVANIVDGCIEHNVKKLIHISSVGAIGFDKSSEIGNENTPFNWSEDFYYMTTKFEGQKIVEQAIKENKIDAVILNPASIMGPGDPNIKTPHNQLYNNIYKKPMIGSFAGGLAIVDVRDLVSIIIKCVEDQTSESGEKYLIVGANKSYPEVLGTIGRYSKRKVYPFKIPPFILAGAGKLIEILGAVFNKRPILTYSYGKLSGWKMYYSAEKSIKEFDHKYIDFNKTIEDTCRYFEDHFINK